MLAGSELKPKLAGDIAADRLSTNVDSAAVSVRAGEISRPPISVLHVFRYFRPDFTGEGLYFEKISPRLARAGVGSDIVASMTLAPPQNLPFSAIGRVHYFGNASQTKKHFEFSLLAWFVANAGKYDAVHFHSAVDRFFVLHILARLFGLRVLQSCTLDDGFERLVGSYRPLYRPFARQLCKLVQGVIAISPRLHDECVTVLPPERVHLIPQGAEIPTESAAERVSARAQWGFAEDDIVLLFVGGLCRRKDPKFLLESFTDVARAGKRVRLVLVGPDLEDDYADDLRKTAANASFHADILFAGYLERPESIYRAADMFVFASLEEGFGNVLLEAMSFGLPVVSRKLPGVNDYFIENGRNGFLFEKADEYLTFVNALIATPELRSKIGAAARQTVVENFGLDAIALRYVSLYRGDK